MTSLLQQNQADTKYDNWLCILWQWSLLDKLFCSGVKQHSVIQITQWGRSWICNKMWHLWHQTVPSIPNTRNFFFYSNLVLYLEISYAYTVHFPIESMLKMEQISKAALPDGSGTPRCYIVNNFAPIPGPPKFPLLLFHRERLAKCCNDA